MLTKERKKILDHERYVRNREIIRKQQLEYYQKARLQILEKKSRQKKKGKFCRFCEISLCGLYWGKFTQKYCKECIADGTASRHWHKLRDRRSYLKRKCLNSQI